MLLSQARVQKFRSIEDSTEVKIEPTVTILVGQNESGKTAFLQALDKAHSSEATHQFNVTEDYPRKSLTEYQKTHEQKPQEVVQLIYHLSADDIKELKALGAENPQETITLTHYYSNKRTVSFNLDESAFLKKYLKEAKLPVELQSVLESATSIRQLLKKLENADTEEGKALLAKLTERFKPEESKWDSLLSLEAWSKIISPRIPKFFYFDDYYLLPGKVNLRDLAARKAADATKLNERDNTVLSLLSMADVSLEELNATKGYEEVKAKLEGISNSITDKIFKYWKQNQDLHVEFDIREDAQDKAPFNVGPNLYIRIRNNRHRVSVPFSQRSKGFIWFFSFIVWFDTVSNKEKIPPILLLDEPGLSLHALAQNDLLEYIDDLAKNHQILYSTHSPFMVKSDELHRARLVEDKPSTGSTVSDNISSSDRRTIFPLQAALGYTIAQNLFIAPKNLLVEGPADLIYLKFFSSQLEAAGREYLREDIKIVPVGGLDKVSTFIALLGANQLELVVLHDYNGQPDAHIESMARQKIIKERSILHYGLFVTAPAKGGKKGTPASYPPADVEDLISIPLYLNLFNGAYGKNLPTPVSETDLPSRDRIIQRIDSHLQTKNITLRKSGGFNHYIPASFLASNPPSKVDENTLNRFEMLFKQVNGLFP